LSVVFFFRAGRDFHQKGRESREKKFKKTGALDAQNRDKKEREKERERNFRSACTRARARDRFVQKKRDMEEEEREERAVRVKLISAASERGEEGGRVRVVLMEEVATTTTTTTTTTTVSNEKMNDETSWLDAAKDGWRALREKKREKREEIEKLTIDLTAADSADDDDDDEEKENFSIMMKAKKSDTQNSNNNDRKKVKLQTQTAAYKLTRKIRSTSEQIRMIGTLCEKWERRLLAIIARGDESGNEIDIDDDVENKTFEMEELKDLCVSLVSILSESVGKLRAYVKEIRGKVLQGEEKNMVRNDDGVVEVIEHKEVKEQLRERTGFKIIARCLERSETLDKRVIQSMAKLRARDEAVNFGSQDSKIASEEVKSKAALVVDAFTLYLKSEEQHLKNENERAARLKREQTAATKKKEIKTKEDPTPVDLSNLDASVEVFKCLKCDLAFQSFALRNTHMEVKHFDGAKMFFCNKCDCTYTSRTALHRHVNKNHLQKWACQLCDPIRCFKSRYDLRKHEERMHFEEMKKRRRELGEDEEDDGDDDTTPKQSSKEMKTTKKSKKMLDEETFFTFVNEFFLESSDDEEDDVDDGM
jgi:uncharacterized C2H2 Zn-finger protein